MKAPKILLILTGAWFFIGLFVTLDSLMNGKYVISLLPLPLIVGSLAVWLSQRWACWLLGVTWVLYLLFALFMLVGSDYPVGNLMKGAFPVAGLAIYCVYCGIHWGEV